MVRLQSALFLALLACSVGGGTPIIPEADQDERALRTLAGTWVVKSARWQGVNMDHLEGRKWIVSGRQLVVIDPRAEEKQQKDVCRIHVSAKESPSHFDVQSLEADESPHQGICNIDGDELKVALSIFVPDTDVSNTDMEKFREASKTTRPKNFYGHGVFVIVLRRQSGTKE